MSLQTLFVPKSLEIKKINLNILLLKHWFVRIRTNALIKGDSVYLTAF